MFIRASNTYITKTSISLDSGITSLVLIPLPDAQESVEDIGRRLYGSLLSSSTLVPHEMKARSAKTLMEMKTPISASSLPLSKKFGGVFSSSPLSSPPNSEDEGRRDPKVYETGKLKRIYKTDVYYKLFQSQGLRLITKPPLPPSGTNIPAYSIFSHVFDDSKLKNIQLWMYLPKNQGSEGEWKPTAPGAIQSFNGVQYQVQWKDGKSASWVKYQ